MSVNRPTPLLPALLVLVGCVLNLAPPEVSGDAVRIGRVAHSELVECSGMDVSRIDDDLLWAVNDGGDKPYLYALGMDGRDRGRVMVAGARNRDWEGLDTFVWNGRPLILIADFGDNDEKYATHTLYIVEEPRIAGERSAESASVEVARRIVFTYPDRSHDAEGVAVDPANGTVLVLTKRDSPPLLFELPLQPPTGDVPVVARHIGTVMGIPPPAAGDLAHKYGLFRSQPTTLDISPDSRRAVVLTYKHAYLFERFANASWGPALAGVPVPLLLPLPETNRDLRQREAACFAPDGRSVLITSEGRGAGIYRIVIDRSYNR